LLQPVSCALAQELSGIHELNLLAVTLQLHRHEIGLQLQEGRQVLEFGLVLIVCECHRIDLQVFCCPLLQINLFFAVKGVCRVASVQVLTLTALIAQLLDLLAADLAQLLGRVGKDLTCLLQRVHVDRHQLN